MSHILKYYHAEEQFGLYLQSAKVGNELFSDHMVFNISNKMTKVCAQNVYMFMFPNHYLATITARTLPVSQ